MKIFIAENMLTRFDYDGFTMTMMRGIIYHKMDTNKAVSKCDIVDKLVKTDFSNLWLSILTTVLSVAVGVYITN